MRSSISSSSDRLPRGAWTLTWLCVLLVFAVSAGGWEIFVRTQGLRATTVDDSPELWIRERERAARLGNEAVVLIGASRMQMGIDLPTLQRYAGDTPVQLAISASPFMPVFEDLASDERITGTVILSFTTQDFVAMTADSPGRLWVDRYQSRRDGRTKVFYQRFENALRNEFNGALLSLGKGVRPQQLLFGGGAGYVRTLPDRSQHADYQAIDELAAYQRRVAIYIDGREPSFRTVTDFDERLAKFEEMVTKLHERGGSVIVVRFPSSKRIWEIDRILYPKEVYWDRLAAATSAKTLHFAEHPELSAFELPDGVHLDYRDMPAFTEALSRLLF